MKEHDADKPVTMHELREVLTEVLREERLVTQQQFHEERAYTTALIQQSTALVVEKVDRIKTMLEDDHRDLAETVETHTKQISVLKRDVAALKH